MHLSSVKTLSRLLNRSVPRVLVFTRDINSFTLTWVSLIGRAGLKAALWADNEYVRTITGDYVQKVGRAWLEAAGAEMPP